MVKKANIVNRAALRGAMEQQFRYNIGVIDSVLEHLDGNISSLNNLKRLLDEAETFNKSVKTERERLMTQKAALLQAICLTDNTSTTIININSNRETLIKRLQSANLPVRIISDAADLLKKRQYISADVRNQSLRAISTLEKTNEFLTTASRNRQLSIQTIKRLLQGNTLRDYLRQMSQTMEKIAQQVRYGTLQRRTSSITDIKRLDGKSAHSFS